MFFLDPLFPINYLEMNAISDKGFISSLVKCYKECENCFEK